MRKKVNLFASFKKEKQNGQMKQEQAQETVRMKFGSAKRLVVSFFIAAMLFCLCLVLINSLTSTEEKVPALVTIKDMPGNMKIVAGEWTEYIAVKEVPVSLLPEDAVQSQEQIQGKFVISDLGKNQILSGSLFKDKEAAAEWENTVEVSVGVGSIAQIVGGTIREGDQVNISTVKETGKDMGDGMTAREFINIPIIQKAYVTQTFTSAGTVVSSKDKEQPVTVINILIPAENEDAFNKALVSGTLRISRICD